MKIVIVLLFLLTSLIVSGQNRYIGEWNDYWGNSFEIKPDSTFKFAWHFDLIGQWANGSWTIKNDTIYFKFVPVYDTIKYSSSFALELSDDETSSVSVPTHIAQLSSGGQDTARMPRSLFYRDDKLFTINSKGKLIKNKEKGWYGKWHLWYIPRSKYYK
jgi:hypothetical protein